MNYNNKTKAQLIEELKKLEGELAELRGRSDSEKSSDSRALAESAEEFRMLVKAMPLIIMVMDKDGRYLSIPETNPPSLLYKPKAELLGKTVRDVFPAETADFFLTHIRKAIEEDKAVNFEYSLNIDGKVIWFAATASKISGEKVIYIARDNTANKLRQQQIFESETRFRLIWENSADGMRLTDGGGKTILVNQAFCRMVKMKKADLQGKPMSLIYKESRHRHVLNKHVERFIDRKIIPYAENEHELWNGEKVWFGVSTSYFSIENEEPYLLSIFRDITYKKRTESQIKMLAQALRSISESITVTDMEDKLIFANSAFEKTYGYRSEEVLGKNISLLRAREGTENITGNILKSTIKGGWQGELFNKRKDGTIFPIYLSTSIVTDDFNNPIALIGVATDITERKDSENKLKETLSLLNATLESTADGILVISRDNKVTGINEKFKKIWEIPEELLATKDDQKFIAYVLRYIKNPAAFVAKIKELYADPLAESFDFIEFKDGRIFERFSQPQVLNGEAVGRVWSFRDVTERINASKTEKALYKISEAVNATEDIQTLYKKIHEVIKELMPVNNFYIALFDPKEDMISFPYFVDEKDPQPAPKKLGKGLTEYVLRNGVNMLVDRKLEKELWIRGEIELIGEPAAIWLGIALKHEKRTEGVLVIQDYINEKAFGENEKQILNFVSEQIALAINRKRTAEELKAYNKELRESKVLLEDRAEELFKLNEQLAESERELLEMNASKDKFFSIIAHDLRSPFTGLLGFSEFLATQLDSLTEKEIRDYSTNIYGMIRNLYNLLENLLEWSRMQTGKTVFMPESVNIRLIIENAVELMNINAIKKGINLIYEQSEDIFINADPNMFNSVIQNLLSNAIKFTKPGGEVKLWVEMKEQSIEVYVSDNGVGIPEDALSKIFRIDKQITTMGTSNEKGSGLGLLVCKEMIEKHGGNIWVDSTPGEGTTFYFSIPSKVESSEFSDFSAN